MITGSDVFLNNLHFPWILFSLMSIHEYTILQKNIMIITESILQKYEFVFALFAGCFSFGRV